MDNRFLREFIAMRQSLASKMSGKAQPTPNELVKPTKSDEMTFRRIVEEKPKDMLVIKYLREMIEEIKEEEEEKEDKKH